MTDVQQAIRRYVPFWISLAGSAVVVVVVTMIRSFRHAAHTVETILREELSGRSAE